MKSFTFIELLIVVSLLSLLLLLATPALRIFQQQENVANQAREIQAILENAQNKTLASEGASSYGVYFDTAANPQQYILFKGSTFATRDTSFDQMYKLPNQIEFSDVNVAGNQVVFDRLSGTTQEPGTISVQQKTDPAQVGTVYIGSIGQISTTPPPVPSDAARVKDSRHILVDYSGRFIDVATESIQLTFPGKNESIPFASNIQNGQLQWEGTILVNGQNQVLAISTYVLNDNSHTRFSIHRDLRYNTEPVTIALSGDTTGTLVSYNNTGQVTQGTSLYVSQPIFQ